jgi:predicted lipoprotein with Yx(FWY)xxD motif
MKAIRLAAAALSVLLALSAGAASADTVTKKDGMLVNSSGMTVYIFDKDVANSGKSACSGQCQTLWPAVMAGDAPVAAPYTVIIREDGSKQLAYKGKPLYLHSKDKKPGDRSGDNFRDVWHVVVVE